MNETYSANRQIIYDKTKNDFEQNRAKIGKGRMAKVYLWNGFAYKCFVASYPQDYIDYELLIQNIISETKLPAIKYYPSEFPHSIKMDYIDGLNLSDKIDKEGYQDAMSLMFSLFADIHSVRTAKLPKLRPILRGEIKKVNASDKEIELALKYIDDLPDGDSICHFDFHFQNIMYSNSEYKIIDWMNAKSGNPIFDYARSYVIIAEFAENYRDDYLRHIKMLEGFNPEDWRKAVYVTALHRLNEYDSPKLREIITENR